MSPELTGQYEPEPILLTSFVGMRSTSRVVT